MKKGAWIALAVFAAAGLSALVFFLTKADSGAKLVPPKIVCTNQGPWNLYSLEPEQSNRPLPRWLRPLPGGYLVAQYAWPESQWVALFHEGKLLDLIAVPCPPTVDPGFFKSAELEDAQVRPQESLVLLYSRKDGWKKDPPLTLTIDLKSKKVRWFHRAPGNHLALVHGEPWIFLFGSETAVWRLPLGVSSAKGSNPVPLQGAEEIQLPHDIPNAISLLTHSSKAFLLAHTKGLSAWTQAGAWIHHTMPQEEGGIPLKFPETLNALSRTPAGIWWQPHPGLLLQVQQDGKVIKKVDRSVFTCGEAHAKDAHLLNLLGKDAQGRLWFGLAVPVLQAEGLKMTVDTKADEAEGWNAETTAAAAIPVFTAEDRTHWEDYLKGTLDRIYIWDPSSSRLETQDLSGIWPTLAAPSGIPQPQGDGSLYAPGGGLLLGAGGMVGFLPLRSIPLAPCAAILSH